MAADYFWGEGESLLERNDLKKSRHDNIYPRFLDDVPYKYNNNTDDIHGRYYRPISPSNDERSRNNKYTTRLEELLIHKIPSYSEENNKISSKYKNLEYLYISKSINNLNNLYPDESPYLIRNEIHREHYKERMSDLITILQDSYSERFNNETTRKSKPFEAPEIPRRIEELLAGLSAEDVMRAFGGDQVMVSNVQLLTNATASLAVLLGSDGQGRNYILKVGSMDEAERLAKELKLADFASRHPRLRPYHAHPTIDVPFEVQGRIVAAFDHVCSNFDPRVPQFQINDYEALRFTQHISMAVGDMLKDPVLHRLYVLAQRHVFMKPLLNEDIAWQQYMSVKPFELVQEMAHNGVSNGLRGLKSSYTDYAGVLSIPSNAGLVLAHNDCRPENFVDPFTGKDESGEIGMKRNAACRSFLIDEGHSCPGYAYQDVAKALLETPNIFADPARFNMYVKAYRFFVSQASSTQSVEDICGKGFDERIRAQAFTGSAFLGAWDSLNGRDGHHFLSFAKAIERSDLAACRTC
jgi:hypothetical protein